MPPMTRPKPLILTEIEIRAALEALGDDAASRLPAGRPDLVSALVRAKRAMRAALPPAGDEPSDQR